MTLQTIRLELARNHDYPDGSVDHGYEFMAPIDANGHIDVQTWRGDRKNCRVWRFWAGEADEFGHLIRTRKGDWAFHYDVEGDPDDDEPGYRFDTHLFKEGEYVSITEHDGRLMTFKVVSVRPACAPIRVPGE